MASSTSIVSVALLMVMTIWGTEAWQYPGGRASHPSRAPHPIRAPYHRHPSRAPHPAPHMQPPPPPHPHPSMAPHRNHLGRGALELSLVNLTITNNLTQTLNVTIGALPPNMPKTITLAPNATGMLRVDVLAAFLVQDILKFRVNNTLYIDTASGAQGALGRFLAQTGLLKVAVSAGPCSTGQAGLVLMDFVAGVLFNNAGCAVKQT